MTKKDYIIALIEEGEHEHQDFKFQISDARKIARSISAFANNSGGHFLVGVKDNGNIAGVSSDEEIYMIEQAASMYCRPEQHVAFELFGLQGKTVLKVDVPEATTKPVKAPNEKGEWRAYYRVADENVLASSMHLKVMQRATMPTAPIAMSFTPKEQELLHYLAEHGGITLTGYMKLAHISRQVAEESVINLCDMGMLTLHYHQGKCLIALP